MLRSLIFCLFLNVQLFASWDELASAPVLSNGRFRPLAAEAYLANKPLNTFFSEESEKLLIVPSSQDPSEWLPLSAQQVPAPIREAYKQGATDRLASLLKERYSPLAGKPYYPGLNYPTFNQLRAEVIYYHYPWVSIILILYALGLLSSKYSPRISILLLASGFFIHTLVLAIRCYILARPPVANMYETLLYVPWVAVFVGALFTWGLKNRSILVGSTVAATLLLALLQMTGLTHPHD